MTSRSRPGLLHSRFRRGPRDAAPPFSPAGAAGPPPAAIAQPASAQRVDVTDLRRRRRLSALDYTRLRNRRRAPTSRPPSTMSRQPGWLPPQLSPSAAAARLRGAAGFLARALPLCRAHTVEFYTGGLWDRLVAPPPAAVLRELRAAGPLALRRPLAEGGGSAEAALWGEWGGGGGGVSAGGPRCGDGDGARWRSRHRCSGLGRVGGRGGGRGVTAHRAGVAAWLLGPPVGLSVAARLRPPQRATASLLPPEASSFVLLPTFRIIVLAFIKQGNFTPLCLSCFFSPHAFGHGRSRGG